LTRLQRDSKDLQQLRLAKFPGSNGQNQVYKFLPVEGWFPFIEKQERDRRVRPNSLLAVNKRVVLAEVKR
jgi:hypothetical protein